MKREEINKLLCTDEYKRFVTLDFFDKMNVITKDIKTDWAIESIIENNCKCPNCDNLSLVGTSPDGDMFLCSKCGYYYCVDDLIK